MSGLLKVALKGLREMFRSTAVVDDHAAEDAALWEEHKEMVNHDRPGNGSGLGPGSFGSFGGGW